MLNPCSSASVILLRTGKIFQRGIYAHTPPPVPPCRPYPPRMQRASHGAAVWQAGALELAQPRARLGGRPGGNPVCVVRQLFGEGYLLAG
jgi:hypothetical protein